MNLMSLWEITAYEYCIPKNQTYSKKIRKAADYTTIIVFQLFSFLSTFSEFHGMNTSLPKKQWKTSHHFKLQWGDWFGLEALKERVVQVIPQCYKSKCRLLKAVLPFNLLLCPFSYPCGQTSNKMDTTTLVYNSRTFPGLITR